MLGSCRWQQGLAECCVNGELGYKFCTVPKLRGLHSAVEGAGADQSRGLDLHFSPLARAVCLNHVKTRYCSEQQWKQINDH